MSEIETLDDWNKRLEECGCCGMPVCPTPEMQCESLSGTAQLAGYFQGTIGFDERDAYMTARADYEGGGWFLYTLSSAVGARLGGHTILPITPQETTVTDSGDGLTGAPTTTYEDPVTVAAARSEGYAAMVAALDFEDDDFSKGNSCDSYRFHHIPWHGAGVYTSAPFDCLRVVFARYRWRVRESHKGSYFKVTWDVVFFPAADDTPGTDHDPVAESTDNVWEWTGPGNAEDANDASWRSEWYALDPPTAAGSKRVVNIRYEGYRSTIYGNKPQVTGEAVDLDA